MKCEAEAEVKIEVAPRCRVPIIGEQSDSGDEVLRLSP